MKTSSYTKMVWFAGSMVLCAPIILFILIIMCIMVEPAIIMALPASIIPYVILITFILSKDEKVMLLTRYESKFANFILCRIFREHKYEEINKYKNEKDMLCIHCGKTKLDATKLLILDNKLDNYKNDKINTYKEKYYQQIPDEVKKHYFIERI
jgi:hypothetical protein